MTLVLVFSLLLTASAVLAAGPIVGGSNLLPPDQLGVNYGEATNLSGQDVRISTANIINVVLDLLGIITVVLILFAGFTWMTAGGNDEQVGKAKKILSAAVIGLVIVMSAYAITQFVVGNLYRATGGQ